MFTVLCAGCFLFLFCNFRQSHSVFFSLRFASKRLSELILLMPFPINDTHLTHTQANTCTFISAICKVPFSIKVVRGLFPWSISPSFSHEILTEGPPITRQCSCVVAPRDTVWLAGPWRIIGGTRPEGPTDSGREETEYVIKGLNSGENNIFGSCRK